MYNAVARLLSFGTVRRLSNRHREGRALGAQGLRMPLPVHNNTRYHGERALGAQGVRMPLPINSNTRYHGDRALGAQGV